MNKRRKLINKITKIGIFAALSSVLYYIKFPLPTLFPSFLEINFSMIPIIIVGLMYGPIDAALVVLIRFIIKMPSTHTYYVGELADLIIGILTIVPSATIYHFNRTKKGGYISLGIAFVVWIISGTLSNLITIPFYVRFYSLEGVLGALSIIPGVTKDNYLTKYLIYGALPFNALLAFFVCLVTLFLYNHISKIFKEDFFSGKKNKTKKIMIMVDSFKGTLTSKEAGEIIKNNLEKRNFHADSIPISDGGDGFLETIQAIINIPFLKCYTSNANFVEHEARYLYDENAKTAYIEMAECCGIQMLNCNELNAQTASSYGLGEQIKKVIANHEITKLVIGIGGSASSDAGAGMLEALGAKFYNKDNQLITKMNNQKLKEVSSLNIDEVKNLFQNIKVEILTDVRNPLLGKNGAVYVFAMQKGAKQVELAEMEANIEHFTKIVAEQAVQNTPITTEGEGAAGGVGYAFNRIIKATMLRGSEKILSLVNFEMICNKYDIIITGEGKFDEQTLNGKIIKGIMEFNPKKLIIVCGISELETSKASVFSIVPTICDLQTSLERPKESLDKLIDNLPL